MSQQSLKTMFKKAFAASWATVCIIIFIVYPARLSIVHGSSLENIQNISTKMAEIQASTYIVKALISFFEIILFSLICIIAGFSVISLLLKYEDVNLKDSALILALPASSFLMGHWVFSTSFLFLAALELLTPGSVTFALIIGVLIGIYPSLKVLRLYKKRNFELGNKLPEEDYRIINWLSISILFASMLYSTSRLSYDSVGIYFSDAKLTALSGHIQFFQGNSFLISSLQTGIQFSAIIQLFGDQTARMFSWVSGCVALVFSLAIAEKVGLSRRAKGVLLALILSSTAFVDLLGDGKVDLTCSAIALAAVYWLITSDNKTHKLLAGFFAGLSMVSRPYNFFLLSVFIGSLYLQKIYYKRKDHGKFGIGPFAELLFWTGLGSGLPLAIHLIENWVVYGSPLAMFADAKILTAGNWQWAFDPQYIWLMRFGYPFVVTFLNTSQSIGNISPIFLAFLPIVVFGKIRGKINASRSLNELLIAALITLLLWTTLFFTIMEIRYIFFLWIIFFIAISEFIVVVLEDKENKALHALSQTLLITLLGFMFLRTIYFSIDTYSPVDKQGNHQCKDFIFCDYLKPINDRAMPGERVLSFLAYRYYLRTDLFACSTKMDEYQKLHNATLQSPEKFWEEVYRQGYTYIAYEKNYSIRHLLIKFIPTPNNTPSWMEIEPIYGSPEGNVVAYKINVRQPPIPRLMNCAQNVDGIWEVQAIETK